VIRVILAGEGKNELGSFAVEAPFRGDTPEPGVVEALLRQIRPDGWQVVDANVPPDALSLRRWLDRARDILAETNP
jgi:hypothetical protein